MNKGDLISKISKKAYLTPVAVSLLLVPVFWNPAFLSAFVQGKELLFKSILLISLLIFSIYLVYQKKLIVKNIFKSPLFLLLLGQMIVRGLTDMLSNNSVVGIYGTYSRGFGLIMDVFLFSLTVYCGLALAGKDLRKLMKIAFVGGVMVGGYAILQKAGIDPLFSNFSTNIFEGRVFSTVGNPSYLGQIMMIYVLIGLWLAWKEKHRLLRICWLAGVVVCLSALLFSETRTAVVGLLFAFVLLTIKYSKKIGEVVKKRKLIWGVGGGILILGVVGALIFSQTRYSFSETAFRSLNSRLEIWNGAIELIMKKPILGYGEETFYIYFPEIITKRFLALEENINLSADRIHNETLRNWFAHGIGGLVIYLLLFGLVLWIFLKSKKEGAGLLALVILANMVQNQFGFEDISIAVLIAFCLGGLISLDVENSPSKNWKLAEGKNFLLALTIMALGAYIGFSTVYKPFMSQIAYTESRRNYNVDYTKAVYKHKEAVHYTPYYSELWYELMFIDPSSMERALDNLEKIEGNSGNLLAWKGNFYADKNPQLAAEFYSRALEKNPHHPNWIRAFADMLYEQGDYENALFLYNQYLEAIPDFWKWSDNLGELSEKDRKSYQTFLKHTPYFWGIVEKVEHIVEMHEAEK